MKKRILISNIITLIVLIIAKPDSLLFFYIGLFFVFLGQTIRFLASATIVKSSTLTVKGIYSVCRNPLYLGTLTIIFGMGIQLSSSDIKNFILLWVILLSAFPYIYYKTIKAEEDFLLSVYKKDFESYKCSVPSLIPKISSIKEIFKKENYDISAFKKNKEYRGFFGALIAEAVILAKIIYAF
ncbi:MAG: methyltransferase [Elusimicrobiota bacterium]